MKLIGVIFLLSVAAPALAGYSSTNYGNGASSSSASKTRVSNQRSPRILDYNPYYITSTAAQPVYATYKPYYITSTAVKPVYSVKQVYTSKPAYVAKPYYGTLQGYDNGYGYYDSSYRPIWSSSSVSGTHYPYYGYGYGGSYAYNPYYYGNYKHGIGYYPGYDYIDV